MSTTAAAKDGAKEDSTWLAAQRIIGILGICD